MKILSWNVNSVRIRMRALGRVVDALRHFLQAPQKLFTWWSYRAPDWKQVNKGRRLDHAWVTPGLRDRLVDARVLENVRGWRMPSDHARCCFFWTRERL